MEVTKSGIFGFYVVDPNLLIEFDGQSVFDVFCELSALTEIKAKSTIEGDKPDHAILEPKCQGDSERVSALSGLLLNTLGLASTNDLEGTFQPKSKPLKEFFPNE